MLSRLILIITVTAIFVLGLVMIFSTTSAEVLDLELDKSTRHALIRQIYYAIAGFVLSMVVWKIGYQNLLRYSPILFWVLTAMLVLVLIPGIGREVNGSRRWIGIAGLSFQPSEFIKYILPAYFIHCILKYRDKDLSLRDFLGLLGVLSIPMLLILVEPNNGTTAVIAFTCVILFLLSRIRFKFWGLPLLVFIVIGGVSASQLPYVAARLNVYLHPELDLKGKGHQPYQAKIAAGSGRLLGKGPGNSLQKLSYLPEAQNDYIAAIYAEEFGFLGIAALILMYMTVAVIGFYISLNCVDRGGFYYAGAITFLISLQSFLNLGVVSGLLPSTGLNLPWFSQGGTSLMANLMGIAILLNISVRGGKNEEESSHYSRGDGRTCVSGVGACTTNKGN